MEISNQLLDNFINNKLKQKVLYLKLSLFKSTQGDAMIQLTKEAIKQALKEKVITKREAQELLAGLSFPRKQIQRNKNKAVGPIQH
jgi:hypothetical protein